jgi:uncharacterized membrane protein
MRAFKKTMSWSFIAFVVTAIVGYFMTGDATKAGWIAVIARSIKFIAYYYHEKWWASKPAPVVATAMIHEDYELESRRTLNMQQPMNVRHCNAG